MPDFTKERFLIGVILSGIQIGMRRGKTKNVDQRGDWLSFLKIERLNRFEQRMRIAGT